MSRKLQQLIDQARQVQMTPQEKDEQRISFAFGNANYEDRRVTRDRVARCSVSLTKSMDRAKG
jgi:hypothetical protein